MNNSKPLISVIIPNYNHSKFLEERLVSILNQTYQNYEIILLDDASNDGSLNILKKYEDHNKVSHLIINNENSGNPFKQWEKGIEIAKGDYIWVAESDDSCSPFFLETLTNSINPKTALAYCDSVIINSKGKKIEQEKWTDSFNNKKWHSSYFNSGLDEIKQYLRYQNCIPNASAVIFSKSLVDKIQFPEAMFYCGDWYIWIELCKLGDISFCSEALNYFRKHDATTREIKSFSKELKRFKEYTFVIKDNSSITERFVYRKKYNWLVDEWLKKSKKFEYIDVIKMSMPTMLYLAFIKRYLMHKITKN